ncbi:hypothetical protein MTHERMOG20_18380 [Moorella thermoacetica]|nr:hypothetical protein MTHERMOG20_18380 [Moorella thermoacetica]
MAETRRFGARIGTQAIVSAGGGIFFPCRTHPDGIEYEANRFTVELITWDEEPELNETLEHFATGWVASGNAAYKVNS